MPLGSLTGANSIAFNNNQWGVRVNHRFNERNQINGRYYINDQTSVGDWSSHAARPWERRLVSQPVYQHRPDKRSVWGGLVNEARVAYQRFGNTKIIH